MDLTPFTLTITFLGLVAFVPIETNGRLETMWVLLPDATQGQGPCDPKPTRPEHYAFLRYPARNLAGPSLASLSKNDLVLTPLHQRDLRIEASPGKSTIADPCSRYLEDGPLRRYRTRRRSPAGELSETPTSDCEERDFSWVPDLRRFASPVATVCDTCLQDPVTPSFPLSRVASRLKLTQGTLRVDSFDTRDDGNLAIYEFVHGSSRDQQSLADEVSLRLEGLTRPVTLILSSLKDPSQPAQRITLLPASPGEEVKIEVLNHVPLELLKLEHHQEPNPEVQDFVLYYRLSALINPVSRTGCEEHRLPFPKLINDNRPICPKAQMSPPAASAVSGKGSHVP